MSSLLCIREGTRHGFEHICCCVGRTARRWGRPATRSSCLWIILTRTLVGMCLRSSRARGGALGTLATANARAGGIQRAPMLLYSVQVTWLLRALLKPWVRAFLRPAVRALMRAPALQSAALPLSQLLWALVSRELLLVVKLFLVVKSLLVAAPFPVVLPFSGAVPVAALQVRFVAVPFLVFLAPFWALQALAPFWALLLALLAWKGVMGAGGLGPSDGRPQGRPWLPGPGARGALITGVGLIPTLRDARFAERPSVPVAVASKGARPVAHRTSGAKQANASTGAPRRPRASGLAGVPQPRGPGPGNASDRVGVARAANPQEARKHQPRRPVDRGMAAPLRGPAGPITGPQGAPARRRVLPPLQRRRAKCPGRPLITAIAAASFFQVGPKPCKAPALELAAASIISCDRPRAKALT